MISIVGLNVNQAYPFLDTIQSDCQVELYIDTQYFNSTDAKKVYIQCEPFSICQKREFLQANQNKYDAIICHDSSLFSHHKQAISYCPACTWIDPKYYESVDTSQKVFQISHISGYKDWTIGHTIRKDLYMRQKDFQSFPITFYRSWVQPHLPDIHSNPFLPETIPTTNHIGLVRTAKIVLFTTYQFSIVMENTKETNYFSEKLLDCLLTKTIPIYYGCPNIQDFFDTIGWICLESNTPDEIQKELHTKLPSLNESYYSLHQATIEKNYETGKQYSDYARNLRNALLKLPFLHPKELEEKDP
jgi:hypothetical protein